MPQDQKVDQASLDKIPFLTELIYSYENKPGSTSGVGTLAEELRTAGSVVFRFYPNEDSEIMVVEVDGKPVAKANISCGPALENKRPYIVREENGFRIEDYDINIAGPTDPGRYTLYSATDHYSTPLYPNTRIPQGASIIRTLEGWVWQDTDGTPHTLDPALNENMEVISISPPLGYRVDIRRNPEGILVYNFQSKIDGSATPYRPLPKAVLKQVAEKFDLKTFLPAGTFLRKTDGEKWQFFNEKGEKEKEVSTFVSSDKSFYDCKRAGDGQLLSARYLSNDFSRWSLTFNDARGVRSGEVVHSIPTLDTSTITFAFILGKIMLHQDQEGPIAEALSTYEKSLRFVDEGISSKPEQTAYYKLIYGGELTPEEVIETNKHPLRPVVIKLVQNYIRTGKWDLSILSEKERSQLDTVDGVKDGVFSLSTDSKQKLIGLYYVVKGIADISKFEASRARVFKQKREEIVKLGETLMLTLNKLGLEGVRPEVYANIMRDLILLKMEYTKITPDVLLTVFAKYGITISSSQPVSVLQ
ncbi:MAG: hypothetical protein WCV91_01895 [Candidatus Margulisiibacteriota bacterium]